MTAWSTLAAAAAGLLWPTATGMAQVVEFEGKTKWLDATGPFLTIDFTSLPENTLVTDQFEDLGVLFIDGFDVVLCCDGVTFPNDEAGLFGASSVILDFTTPQRSVAFDTGAFAEISLFREGRLIYTSGVFGFNLTGFAGLVSTGPFDEALIVSAFGSDVFIDDLHFGLPGPGSLWLLAIAALHSSGHGRARSIRSS